jgi:hypothetical protein
MRSRLAGGLFSAMVLIGLALSVPGIGAAADDFYAGKTLQIIVSSGVGSLGTVPQSKRLTTPTRSR